MKKIYVDFILNAKNIQIYSNQEELNNYFPLYKATKKINLNQIETLQEVLNETRKKFKKERYFKKENKVIYNLIIDDNLANCQYQRLEHEVSLPKNVVNNKIKDEIKFFEQNIAKNSNEHSRIIGLEPVIYELNNQQNIKKYSSMPLNKQGQKLKIVYGGFTIAKDNLAEKAIKMFENNKIKLNSIRLASYTLALQNQVNDKQKAFIDFRNGAIIILGVFNNKTVYYNKFNTDLTKPFSALCNKYDLKFKELILNSKMIMKNWSYFVKRKNDNSLQKLLFDNFDALYTQIFAEIAKIIHDNLKNMSTIELHTDLKEYFAYKLSKFNFENISFFDDRMPELSNINKYSLALLNYKNPENTQNMLNTLNNLPEVDNLSIFKRFFGRLFKSNNLLKSKEL